MTPSERTFVVLAASGDDDSWGEWWVKGRYDATSPEDAVRVAYDDHHVYIGRGGQKESTVRVAVTGTDEGWQEFLLTHRAVAAELVSLRPAQPIKRDDDES